MAGIKISQLPVLLSASLTDLFADVQSGVTSQGTLQQILTLFLNSLNSGSQLTNGQILIGSTSNPPVASALTAGSNISIVNGAGSITISATGSTGIMWNNITAATQTMSPNMGYVTDRSSLVTLTLPTTAAFGTMLYIQGLGSGGWTVAQNASQQIIVGSSSTTAGVSGSLSSTNQSDSIALLCVTANLTWTSLGAPQGILSLV